MSLQISDQLFVDCLGDERALAECVCFGENIGVIYDFDMYKNGYKYAAMCLYDQFCADDIFIVDRDALVFPLCFLYRQTIELYIKRFFISFSDGREDEMSFFTQVSHSLDKAWEKTKPHIQKLVDRFPSYGIDLGICTQLIHQIDKFDKLSMRMRYPITKTLEPTNTHAFHLNVHHLHSKMKEFFEYLDNIHEKFDNVICQNDIDENIQIALYRKVKNVSGLFTKMREVINKYQYDKVQSIDDVTTDSNLRNEELKKLFSKASYIHVAMLVNLFNVGRSLCFNEFKLSENLKDRTKDLFKLLKEADDSNMIYRDKSSLEEKLLCKNSHTLKKYFDGIRIIWNECFTDTDALL